MKYQLRKVIGLILWWTEGTRSRRDKRWKRAVSYPVEITNTDPRIIRLFLEFLRKDIGVIEKKLKVQIQIHEGDNQKKLENFWSRIAKIPKSRFNKTIIRPQGKKIGKSIGTCKIRYTDKKTYLKLKNQLEDILRVFKI
jgi:hypothetical protein